VAVKRCEDESTHDALYYRSIMVTMQYNLGRLCEEMYQFEDAVDFYKNILREHPNYIDCEYIGGIYMCLQRLVVK